MTLKSYYSNLPGQSPKEIFKAKVKVKCRISDKTFYNWMEDESRIPDWARSEIDEIKKSINSFAS